MIEMLTTYVMVVWGLGLSFLIVGARTPKRIEDYLAECDVERLELELEVFNGKK